MSENASGLEETPHDINPDRGPRYRCKNGSCVYLKPRTIIKESERKTQYLCPGCKRALNIDWHDTPATETNGGPSNV